MSPSIHKFDFRKVVSLPNHISSRSRTRTKGGQEEEEVKEEAKKDSEGADAARPREQPQAGGVHAQDVQPDEEARRIPPLPVRAARPPG